MLLGASSQIRRRTVVRAWLITWEWIGDAASIVAKVAGILDARKSPKHVGEIVEFMYAQATSTLSELAAYSKKRSNNPYRARVDFTIQCGHHPWLFAELIDDLSITIDPQTGRETITWLTQGVHVWDKSEIKLISPPMRRTFSRIVQGPISNELLWDRSLGRIKDKFFVADT